MQRFRVQYNPIIQVNSAHPLKGVLPLALKDGPIVLPVERGLCLLNAVATIFHKSPMWIDEVISSQLSLNKSVRIEGAEGVLEISPYNGSANG